MCKLDTLFAWRGKKKILMKRKYFEQYFGGVYFIR